jgi:hypothetical protein
LKRHSSTSPKVNSLALEIGDVLVAGALTRAITKPGKVTKSPRSKWACAVSATILKAQEHAPKVYRGWKKHLILW